MKKLLTIILASAMTISMIMPAAAGQAATPESSAVVAAGEILEITEDTAYETLTIEDGAQVVPADGYSLIMIADGEVVRAEAGEYQDVEFVLQPIDYTFGTYDETGNEEGYTRRYLYNSNPDEPIFIEAAFDDVSIEEKDGYLVFDGNDSDVVVRDDGMQVLSTEGGNMRFQNIDIEIYGTGICEINDIFGAGIAIVGEDSNVVVDDVEIKTVGAIMSAMNSGSGNVLLMNSELNGYGDASDATGLHSGILPYSPIQGSITEVPWVLGLNGTLRTINVIGDTNALYYNVEGTSNGWGVFSTDGGKSFIMINTDAEYDDSEGAEFESLYGTYILGLPTWLLGFKADLAEATGNTYGIVARHGFTLGESSQENLNRLDTLISIETPEEETDAEGESNEEAAPEGDSSEETAPEGDSSEEAAPEGDSAKETAEEGANLITLPSGEVIGTEEVSINAAAGVWQLFKENVNLEEVEARRSLLKARYGVMSHGAQNDTFNITGTDIIADEAAFLMKQAYMTINMDGTVNIDSPIIIHEQISDDAGMSTYAYDSCWSEATAPFLYEVADNGGAPEQGVTANMTGMTLEGDFYNTDTNGAFLDLNFDDTEVTGAISSATFIHNNASFYVAYNPEFDDQAEESDENLKYICVDETGKAYQTTVHFSFFGGCSYQPVYEDVDGIVTFAYDEDGAAFAPEEIVGYAIFYTDAQYCSDGEITVGETINNPVNVTLANGSVWNVTGTSYVAELNVDDTSSVNGEITEVDGGYIVSPAK